MNFSTVPPCRSIAAGHGVEVAQHHAPQRLWVQTLAERRRAGDVAEDDGDGLAHLRGRRGIGEPLATGVAEARPLRVLDATSRTGRHGRMSLVPVINLEPAGVFAEEP